MSTYFDAANRGPRLRTASAGIIRQPAANAAPCFQQPPRSVPHQTLVGLTPNTVGLRDSLGHVIKRQKTDNGYIFTASPIESYVKHESPTSPFQESPQSAFRPPTHSDQVSSSRSPISTNPPLAPPLPLKPCNQVLRKSRPTPTHAYHVRRDEVQAKPYKLEIPSSTPQFGKHDPADFFPWVGTHFEDILNEAHTRNGYFDKVQLFKEVGNNSYKDKDEISTARAPMWLGLKHKSGMHVLSSLFISVINQRQAYATVAARCSFKPPPRVTLTDTKREAWLRDLANPTIPLRRLSRTIPHGIRGKVLLDHCLAKRIPICRAVWLAKCVGANEIRAFKRKGTSGAFATGGETKWIKDWTINVEQFVEAVTNSCGSPEWSSGMIYGLQLVRHICSEHLLDEEHFLEWVILSFQTSGVDHLPSWFLVLRDQLTDMMRNRSRGRRLVEALLKQLNGVSSSKNQEAMAGLRFELSVLLRSLALSNPACFVIPDCWKKYEALLRSCGSNSELRWTFCFQRIRARNLRLVRSPIADLQKSNQTPRQILIILLDTSYKTLDLKNLSEASLQAVEDRNLLICTLIEWSTTRYRDGLSRIYIALRLLRLWDKAGFDLDQAILHFLGRVPVIAGLHMRSVFKLVGELIRTRLFSIGKYLQWLMARGTHVGADSTGAFEIELLDNIPVYDLPQHVLNLRNILMRVDGRPTAEPENIEDAVKRSLGEKVGLLQESSKPSHDELLQDLTCLSGTIQFSISRWIRQRVASECQRKQAWAADMAENTPKKPTMAVNDFRAIRKMLEDLQDFSVLADVLNMVSISNYKPLLEGIVETMNCHMNIFAALGVADTLFRKFVSGLEQYYTRDLSDKSILLSLADLGECFPSASQTTRTLRQEILVCNSKNPVTTCSPVSDNMAEALPSSDSDFLYEVEHLLNGGSSIDKHVLSHLFNTMSARLRTAWCEDRSELWSLVDLLGQLRPFQLDAFDRLMLDWAQECLWLNTRPALINLIVPLVCGRVLDLRSLLQQFVSRLDEGADQEHGAGLSIDVLALILVESSQEDQSSVKRIYRYYREVDMVLHNAPDIVVALICYSSKGGTHDDPVIQQRCQTMLSSPRCLCLIRTVLLLYEPAVVELGQAFGVGPLRSLAFRILDNLLCLNASSRSRSPIFNHDIGRLLHLVNDFNVGFARLKLFIILALQDCAPDRNSGNGTAEGITVLVNEAASTFSSRPAIWLSLLSSLPEGYPEKFHAGCMSELVASMPEWTSGSRPKKRTLAEPGDSTDALLTTIDGIEDKILGDGVAETISMVLMKCSRVQSSCRLGTARADPVHKIVDEVPKTQATGEQGDTYQWIDILLRLLIIHQHSVRQPKFPQHVLCQLLLSLSLLATLTSLTIDSMLSTHLLDTIAFFSDSLTPENRSHCRAVLCDQSKLHDSRFQSIFSSSGDKEVGPLQLICNTTSAFSAAEGVRCMSFALRRWEMVQDATPTVGENDTSLSLTLFGTRKAIL